MAGDKLGFRLVVFILASAFSIALLFASSQAKAGDAKSILLEEIDRQGHLLIESNRITFVADPAIMHGLDKTQVSGYAVYSDEEYQAILSKAQKSKYIMFRLFEFNFTNKFSTISETNAYKGRRSSSITSNDPKLLSRIESALNDGEFHIVFTNNKGWGSYQFNKERLHNGELIKRSEQSNNKVPNKNKPSKDLRLAFLHWPKVVFDYEAEFVSSIHGRLKTGEQKLSQIINSQTDLRAFLEINGCHQNFIVAGLRNPSRRDEYSYKAAYYKALSYIVHPSTIKDKGLRETDFSQLSDVEIESFVDVIDIGQNSALVPAEVQLVLDMDTMRPGDFNQEFILPNCEKLMVEGQGIFLAVPENMVAFFEERFRSNKTSLGYLGALASDRNKFFEQIKTRNRVREQAQKKRNQSDVCRNIDRNDIVAYTRAVLNHGCE